MIPLLQQAGDILIPPVVNLELEHQITGWNSLDWLSISWKANILKMRMPG